MKLKIVTLNVSEFDSILIDCTNFLDGISLEVMSFIHKTLLNNILLNIFRLIFNMLLMISYSI
jgi:hypothetical protein